MITCVITILNPIAFLVVEIHTRNLVNDTKGWCDGKHNCSERRCSHRRIISVGTRCDLQPSREGRVSWNILIMQAPEDGPNAIVKSTPLAGHPCLTPRVIAK